MQVREFHRPPRTPKHSRTTTRVWVGGHQNLGAHDIYITGYTYIYTATKTHTHLHTNYYITHELRKGEERQQGIVQRVLEPPSRLHRHVLRLVPHCLLPLLRELIYHDEPYREQGGEDQRDRYEYHGMFLEDVELFEHGHFQGQRRAVEAYGELSSRAELRAVVVVLAIVAVVPYSLVLHEAMIERERERERRRRNSNARMGTGSENVSI